MISFSNDSSKKISAKDGQATRALAEKFFGTAKDPDQAPITPENNKWIRTHIPECFSVVKSDGKVIGFSLVLPATKKLMQQFLSKKITERELFNTIKKSVNYDNMETIYLCSSFIVPEFRRKGIMFTARMKSLSFLQSRMKQKPTLFFWGYSLEGRKFAKAIGKALRLQVKARPD